MAGCAPGLVPVALDANVFLDLHGPPSPTANRTRDVIEGILDGRIDLLLTPELRTELDRRLPAWERRAMQGKADGYPELPVAPARFEAVLADLLSRLPSRPSRVQTVSDARQVAYAAAAGVAVFATRDEDAIARLGPVATEHSGVRMVTPEELVALVDEAENAPAYRPAALLGTGYSRVELPAGDDVRASWFLDTPAGELRRDFRGRLRALAAGRPAAHRLLYTDPQGAPVGLVGTSVELGVLRVPVLRLARGPLAESLAAQVVAHLRELALQAGVPRVVVTEPHLGDVLFAAAQADGFHPASEGLTAHAIPLLSDMAGLPTELRELLGDPPGRPGTPLAAAEELASSPSPEQAARLEHDFRPLRLLDAPLPVWLVPIKPAWSSQLFDAPRQLFGQPDELGISREHVYYRAARSAGEAAPGRVLWYASAPEMTVVACSALVDVDQGPPDELWKRYRRLGVYSRQDVRRTAGKAGKVRCLHVADTEVFRRPVPLLRLRELAAQNCHSVVVRSPQQVSPALFAAVMKESRS